MINYIYLNGCSFIAGHDLAEDKTVGYKLSKELKVPYISKAVNGNSLTSIIQTTTNHLLQIPTEDLLVIIGITWPNRDCIPLNKNYINFTPKDFIEEGESYNKKTLKSTFYDYLKIVPKEKTVWRGKLGKDKRLVDVNDISNNTSMFFDVINNKTDYDELFDTFSFYLIQRLKYDKDYIKNVYRDQYLQLVLFESFFKSRNINYYFLDYSDWIDNVKGVEYKLDKSRIVKLTEDDWKVFLDPISSHPSSEGTSYIVQKLINNIK